MATRRQGKPSLPFLSLQGTSSPQWAVYLRHTAVYPDHALRIIRTMPDIKFYEASPARWADGPIRRKPSVVLVRPRLATHCSTAPTTDVARPGVDVPAALPGEEGRPVLSVVESEPRGAERRKRPQFLVPDAMFRLDVLGTNRKRTLKVAVRDVCTSGACLLSSRPLPVREPVKLHPPADAQHKIDAVDARVTYCKSGAPGSRRYRIGVEFQDSE